MAKVCRVSSLLELPARNRLSRPTLRPALLQIARWQKPVGPAAIQIGDASSTRSATAALLWLSTRLILATALQGAVEFSGALRAGSRRKPLLRHCAPRSHLKNSICTFG